jgi:hypothetical protein
MARRIGKPVLMIVLLLQLVKAIKPALQAVVTSIDDACGYSVGTVVLVCGAMFALMLQDEKHRFLVDPSRHQDHPLSTPNSQESNRTL